MVYSSISGKSFRERAGSLSKKLAVEFGLIQAEYEKESVSILGAPIDLSGAGVTLTAFVADRGYTITAAYLVYTEVSSANAGVNIKVGKTIVGTDDDDYFVASVATEVSKEAGYRKSLTLLKTAVVEGDIITINCAGSKTGTGAVTLQLYLTRA